MKIKVDPIIDDLDEDTVREIFNKALKGINSDISNMDHYNLIESFCQILFRESLKNILTQGKL